MFRGKTKRLTPACVRGEAYTYAPRFHPAYSLKQLSLVSRYACSRRAASLRLRLKTDLPRKSWFFAFASVHPRYSRRLRASSL